VNDSTTGTELAVDASGNILIAGYLLHPTFLGHPVSTVCDRNRRCFCFEIQCSGNSIGLFELPWRVRGRPLSGDGHRLHRAVLGDRVDSSTGDGLGGGGVGGGGGWPGAEARRHRRERHGGHGGKFSPDRGSAVLNLARRPRGGTRATECGGRWLTNAYVPGYAMPFFHHRWRLQTASQGFDALVKFNSAGTRIYATLIGASSTDPAGNCRRFGGNAY